MRNRPVWILTGILPLFMVGAVLAGSYIRSLTNPSPRRLLQMAIDASGGMASLQARATKGVHITGRVTFQTMGPVTHPIEAWIQGEHFTWIDKGAGIPDVRTINDAEGRISLDQVVYPLPAEQLASLRAYATIWRILLQAAAPGAELRPLGIQKMPNTSQTVGVRFVRPHDFPINFYFDMETHRLAGYQVQCHRPTVPGAVTETDLLGLYVEENGFWEPLRCWSYEDGRMLTSSWVQHVDESVSPPLDIFKMPETPTTPRSVTVPMSIVDGKPSIMARIGKLPHLPFRLDLNLALTSFDPNLIQQLVRYEPEKPLVRRGMTETNIVDSARPFPPRQIQPGTGVSGERVGNGETMWTFDSIEIGQATVHHFSASRQEAEPGNVQTFGDYALARPPRSVGTLGQNILGRFQLTFDFPAKTLTLAPRHNLLPGGVSVPVVLDLGWPYVSLRLGGLPFEAILSTTEEKTTLKATELPPQLRRLAHAIDTIPGTDAASPVTRYMVRVPSFWVGGAVVHNYPVYFLDPGAAFNAGMSTRPSVLGTSFFHNSRFTLDYDEAKLVVAPSTHR